MDDWLKGYWGTQINAVVSQMTFWYFWNLFSFRGCSVPPFDSWEHVLSPCPWGLTKHAGTGEATDGTSIPFPGCEFMFSKLWISFHIHLLGRLPAVSCGQALYATYAFGRADETETSIHFKLLLHIQQPVRGYAVNTHGPMRNLTETFKCHHSRHSSFFLPTHLFGSAVPHSFLRWQAWRFYSTTKLYKSALVV